MVEPCSTPSNAATASGIVQRTEGERDITRVTFDLNTLDKDSPITLTAGRLNNFGLNVGIPIGQKNKYYSQHISQQISKRRREKFMKLPKFMQMKAARLLSKFPDAVEHVSEGEFSVRSETGHGSYRVMDKIDTWTCECRYFLEEGETCKHIAAVMLNLDRQIGAAIETADKTVRQSYTQNWEVYDLAQTAELRLFDPLLLGLVEGIEDPEPVRTTGRPRTGFSADLFCAIRKVASMYSCRRSYGFLETAHERKYLNSTPNYSISSRLLIRDDVTPILKELVSLSALPLAAVEEYATVAIDSSGFRTNSYGFYCQEKHGPSRRNVWLKASLLAGCRTHGVFRADITENTVADVTLFQELLGGAVQAGFDIGKATADKGYLSRANYNYGSELGISVFIPFKSGSIAIAKGSPTWKKMCHLFYLKRDEFDEEYHIRSNVESVFSAIKMKFGETIKSKNPIAQTNEAYCKIIAYNITVVIHEMFEHGLESHLLPVNGDSNESIVPNPYAQYKSLAEFDKANL